MPKVIFVTLYLLLSSAAVVIIFVTNRLHQNADTRDLGIQTYNRLPANESSLETANLPLTPSSIVSSSDDTIRDFFVKRRAAVRAACSQMGKKSLSEAEASNLYSHMIVDDKHRLIYCYVPKVACTSWKMVILVLTGTVEAVRDVRGAHTKGIHTMMSALTMPEREKRMKTYKKLMVHREPFSRLLSAYIEKFQSNTSAMRRTLGRQIIARYRVKPSRESLQSGSDVKFSEFVRFILYRAKQFGWLKLNEHWQPQVSLCQPCAVDYDYYSEAETVESDAEAILSLVGASADVRFPKSHVTNSTKHIAQFYKDLNEAQIRWLLRLYSEDYALFGYRKPAF